MYITKQINESKVSSDQTQYPVYFIQMCLIWSDLAASALFSQLF